MKKDSSFVANMILYFGSGFLLFLVIFALIVPIENHHVVIRYLPTLIAASGIPVLYLSIRHTKKIHQIFIGFELLFWGVILVLRERNEFQFPFTQWWPIIGITAGLFLCIAGLVKYKKLLVGYFITSLALFFLGIWFSLFSFNIIKVPYKVVAIVGGPLFIIMTGLLIIALFLLQKNYSNFVIDNKDDLDMETEEITNDGE